jgi:hypothetical protein
VAHSFWATDGAEHFEPRNKQTLQKPRQKLLLKSTQVKSSELESTQVKTKTPTQSGEEKHLWSICLQMSSNVYVFKCLQMYMSSNDVQQQWPIPFGPLMVGSLKTTRGGEHYCCWLHLNSRAGDGVENVGDGSKLSKLKKILLWHPMRPPSYCCSCPWPAAALPGGVVPLLLVAWDLGGFVGGHTF